MQENLLRTYEAQCLECTQRVRMLEAEKANYSEKSTAGTILLTLIFGLHRITNGKVLSGILFAVTCNGFIIWWILDMVKIAAGKFTDQNGKPINSAKVVSLELEINKHKQTLAELQKQLNQLKAMDI